MQTRLDRRFAAACAALVAAAVLASCGGAAAVVVPFFTFGFGFNGTLAGSLHTVSLNLSPNEPTTATGSFDANTNITLDLVQHDATGTFSECTLTLQVPTATPPLATSYNGRFTSKDVIELTPVAPSTQPVLTLTRSFGTDSRATTC